MSSPRQNMVLVTSPQPNELEQKKKRQTLERAKANHLSKQLQMRLQYAKLKVEHGWQRQNLNEVENLYFHHSHLRGIRQGHGTSVIGQRLYYGPVANPDSTTVLADTQAVMSSSVPSGVAEQPVGSSLSLPRDCPASASPPPQHATTVDSQLLSSPLQAPMPAAGSAMMNLATRLPSTFDLTDPHILARLAQLQAQIQMPSQPQPASCQPSTTTPLSTSTSQLISVTVPIPPATLMPTIQPSQLASHTHLAGIPLPSPTYPPQPLISTPASGSVPPHPVGTTSSTPALHNLAIGASQSLVPTTTPSIVPTPTTQAISPVALTYDSFWSTHASSTGPTRALYRTHTGFIASATPTGNVAMLTPGGHVAVMTADGVYVGGATNRSA